MKLLIQILILAFAFTACNPPDTTQTESPAQSDSSNSETVDVVSLFARDTTVEGYRFRFGYYKYNEESLDFQNPGYLEVYKDGQMIFHDSLKAYDEIYFESFGYHELNKRIFLFNIHYGGEACDYPANTRIYGISDNKVHFMDEITDIGNEHAGISTDIIFPEDSNGIKGHLMITEALEFNRTGTPEDTIEFEKGDTNRFDTIVWQFKASGFKKIRETKNIGGN